MKIELKLFDSELKVMEALWKEGDLTASQLAIILKKQTGWNRNTTYTIINKLIDKGVIERYEPNFICKAIITKEEVQQYEIAELIRKLFDGSVEMFLYTLLSCTQLSADEINRLKQLLQNP